MAKKKIEAGTIVIRMSDDGSYKIVEQQAKKTGAAFNTVGLNAQSADRAMKGVSRQSSNATKNFSKMAQGIGGFLVPAYATLAAQLFAIDAAFRFLKDAADFRVLKEGQAAFAATTGMAIQSLAKDLMIATDAQISFKEASQAAAIGLAAGLSPTQLKELGAAAKTVSIALGRDVTDSFNRLVRGVTKAEPELLDELGIVLRLEEASIKYAAALGLNKNQLTTFQKSQAVTIEVLDQAQSKFGAINEIMDPTTNALNKLGVAFDELLNKARPTIAFIAEFFSEVLTKNIAAATSAMLLFLGGVAGSLMPQIPTFDSAKAGAQAAGGITEILGDPKNKTQSDRLERLSLGTYTKNDLKTLKKALTSQRSTLLSHNKLIEADKAFHLSNLKIMDLEYEVSQKQGIARIAANWKLQLSLMTKAYGTFLGTVAFAGKALVGLARVLGYIGIGIIAFQSVASVMDRFKTKSEELEKFINRITSSTTSMDGLNQELEKMAEVRERGLLKGIDQQIMQLGKAFQSADLINKLRDFQEFALGKKLAPEEYKKFRTEFVEYLGTLQRLDPEMTKYYNKVKEGKDLTTEEIKELRKRADYHISNQQAVQQFTEAQSALVKINNALVNQLPKLAFQDQATELEKQVESMRQLGPLNEKYAATLLQIEGRLGTIRAIQEETYNIEIARQGVALEVAENSFGTKAQSDAKKYQKIMDAVLKLEQMRNEFQAASYQLSLAQGKEEIAAGKKRQDLARAALVNQQMAYTIALAESNEVFKVYNTMLDQLTEKLGSSIGAALRGEANAFQNIGEELTKTLTDAIGKGIAERMMEDLIGGTVFDPNRIVKEMYKTTFEEEGGSLQSGMSTAAKKIYEAIERGSDYHNLAILQAFRQQTAGDIKAAGIEKAGLQTARTAHLNQVKAYTEAQINRDEAEAALDNLKKYRIVNTKEIESMGIPSQGIPATYKKAFQDPISGQQFTKDQMANLRKINEDIISKSTDTLLKNNEAYTLNEERLAQFDISIESVTERITGLNQSLAGLDEEITKKQKTSVLPTGDTTDKTTATETTTTFADSVDTFTGVSTKFLGGTAMLLGAAGKSEEAAKLMEIAAKIQMAAMIYQGASNFFGGMSGKFDIMGGLKGLFGGGARQGGLMSAPGYRSYSEGGTATGPSSGYLAELHGTEAVVPLPNGRSIPVEMQGKSGGTNNISVNVNMANGETTMTSDRGGEMGLIIAAAVKEVIADEQRAGGLLSGT